ncbi:ATP-binding protein [Lacticaseibacillus nasuensis]|uniref:ATP-binding protein n=1 Tax=Lacticaseibacillus nasuensis TaxID=944671 RepID=UPI00224675D7|nr:ATP-binding protein [Lacticaseibacillus nasuensis]MCX2456315.1 ATP-binding protein [Lacticaseibacillus nasuensis]
MREINLPPFAPNLIESTRSIGYSFEMALADIIDNSISNFAERVDVRFAVQENPYVAIIDNGIGMTPADLEAAMRYGSTSSLSKRSASDLGRFGLGLKMASMSQCRVLTVISKFRGTLSAAQWDLDRIHQTKSWSLLLPSDEEIKVLPFANALDEYESGTVVLWQKLDRMANSPAGFHREFNDRLDYADRHLRLVFHRFLSSRSQKDSFELYFNNRKLEPIDPFMRNNPATQPLEPETLFVGKQAIQVQPYIMPFANKLTAEERRTLNEFGDLNLKQGLYIYRNKRLIAWGKWFRLLRDSDLQRLTRVQVDLPNNLDDEWAIDVKKSSAQIPSGIKDALAKIVMTSVGKSERVYRYRGTRISKDSSDHVWNRIENRDKIQYLINRDLPQVQALYASLDDAQSKLMDSVISMVEDAFPYNSVYYDLAKDREPEEKTMSDQQVYDAAKQVISKMSRTRAEARQQLHNMRNIDVFQKYPNVLQMLQEEYDD